MLKVYLVDDEQLILDELIKIIDWNQYGYEIIGHSTNSRQAYQEIIVLKPHLVISDINMPQITGLYLFEMVKAINPLISFCFLSAYDTFEYVQEALQLGAVNYLKKPIVVHELVNLISNISKHYDIEFSEKLFDAIISRQYYEKDSYIEKLFFNNDFIKKGLRYRIVTFVNFKNKNTVPNLSQCTSFYPLYCDEKMRIFICYETDLEHLQSLAEMDELSIGVSMEFEDFAFVSKHLRKSRIAAFQHFITGKQGLTVVDQNPNLAVLINEINATKNTYELQMLLSDLKNKMLSYNIKCFDLQAIYRTVMFNLVKYGILPYNYKFEEISVVNYYENLDDFVKEINSYFIDDSTSEASVSVIDLVKNEIENNISQHYSLSYFAQKYYYNLSYFSQFFKKQTGCSFAEYVATVKMNIAKLLMLNTDFSLSQIAEQVGYKDYYHFSKMFKKMTGSTPSDFSKSGRHVI